MNFAERIFHSVLFEIGAVSVATLAVVAAGSHDAGTAAGAGLVMAGMAMVWNFIFNYGFDKIFTGKREARGLGLRVFHTLAFEAGLLLFTVPVLAHLLQLSLWHALLADIGLTALITVYALVFNWMFDHARAKWLEKRSLASECVLEK
ncbi:Predicted membrane protein [Bergeriella denitrificans]|uniref:Predicted membrane protein n=2 Tax=Bergeriella denitrificans TaxID=494 RepID=A0A378UJ74_BERDE|nr:Predicted membrane protein [Bergeriella denitrificans]